jgi:branched-subunit amino acid aminotransferase/4-amino-4-deoxychorismate lyase
MRRQIFFHKSFCDQQEGLISVRDLSFLRGYGVFDYFKTLQGKPLFVEDYLNRFVSSAAAMHLPLHYSPAGLKKVVEQLIQRNELEEDSGIRILLSGGYSTDSISIGEPKLIIIQEDLPEPPLVSYAALKSYPYQRESSHIKSINYGLPIRLRAEGLLNGFTDVLYFSEDGITETSRCNVFIIKNGIISTPASGILYGVTRKQVILCAKAAGYEVREEAISLSALMEADECFITSTTKGIYPIARVDDTIFPSTIITERLRDIFDAWCLAAI